MMTMIVISSHQVLLEVQSLEVAEAQVVSEVLEVEVVLEALVVVDSQEVEQLEDSNG